MSSDEGEERSRPVVQETATVRARAVPTGRVRVATRVTTARREVRARLEDRNVVIERTPRDVVLDEAPAPWREGDTMVFPVLEEVVVVTTRWRLVEEVRVREERSAHEETLPVELARHDVIVEREDGDDETVSPVSRG